MTDPIIRKNIVFPTVSFAASDGSGLQPTAVYMLLSYVTLTGAAQTASITLAYNATTNTWTGSWDTSAAGTGEVTWFVYGTGPVQAAAEGTFNIEANKLNTV